MLTVIDYSTPIGSTHRLGIVRWKGAWWFSGMYFPISGSSIVEKENESNILSVFNLTEYISGYEEYYRNLKNAFVKYTGHEVVFIPKVEVNKFLNLYIKFYNNNLSEQDCKPNVYSENTGLKRNVFSQLTIPFEENEILTISINESRGLEIIAGVEHALPLRHNQFYKEDQMEQSFKEVFFGGCSAEFSKYCVESFMEKYTFIDKGWNMFLDDLDFSLRYFNPYNYHPETLGYTKPSFMNDPIS